MSKDKPIWTWHGDLALQLDYAIPYLEKSVKVCEDETEKKILDSILARAIVMRDFHHLQNRSLTRK